MIWLRPGLHASGQAREGNFTEITFIFQAGFLGHGLKPVRVLEVEHHTGQVQDEDRRGTLGFWGAGLSHRGPIF